jgi:RNase adaptor protein for sRNA GlmZ degradation
MLKVKIFSFSYKKSGIPKDATINGGGFVFDCRYIFNPGRLPEFVPLSGLDLDVKNYLDKNEQMKSFLENIYCLIDSAADNYLERNFTDLMVSFGCTGGQHRSVYAAESLKEHLFKKYNSKINIEVKHTELKQD